MGRANCAIERCRGRVAAHGWCDKHYRRWRKHGDPLTTLRIIGDDVTRFWSYVDRRGPGECWQWRGAISPGPRGLPGYGNVYFAGRTQTAHIVAYRLAHGDSAIPDGHVLDHLCRNQHCVNPSHLEPVTQRVNIHRGLLLKVTDERVEEIARRYAAGASLTALARQEGVTPQALRLRLNNRRQAA
ncbi:HNH endonuclease [Actinomadura geliboluensis]|uniref:HNH endonuclease n=1 Tax=Actinomadura geliboluensis TaxID=882440 RepID=UPI0036BFFB31